MEKEKVYVGIDVAKASMDIAVHSTGQLFFSRRGRRLDSERGLRG